MRRYPVYVETREGATIDESVRVQISEALSASPQAQDSEVTLDRERGLLRSTFAVEANGLDEAQAIAGQLFKDAARAAGLPPSLDVVVGATDEPTET